MRKRDKKDKETGEAYYKYNFFLSLLVFTFKLTSFVNSSLFSMNVK